MNKQRRRKRERGDGMDRGGLVRCDTDHFRVEIGKQLSGYGNNVVNAVRSSCFLFLLSDSLQGSGLVFHAVQYHSRPDSDYLSL